MCYTTKNNTIQTVAPVFIIDRDHSFIVWFILWTLVTFIFLLLCKVIIFRMTSSFRRFFAQFRSYLWISLEGNVWGSIFSLFRIVVFSSSSLIDSGTFSIFDKAISTLRFSINLLMDRYRDWFGRNWQRLVGHQCWNIIDANFEILETGVDFGSDEAFDDVEFSFPFFKIFWIIMTTRKSPDLLKIIS